MNFVILFLRIFLHAAATTVAFAGGLSELLMLLACAVVIGIIVAVVIAITRGWV